MPIDVRSLFAANAILNVDRSKADREHPERWANLDTFAHASFVLQVNETCPVGSTTHQACFVDFPSRTDPPWGKIEEWFGPRIQRNDHGCRAEWCDTLFGPRLFRERDKLVDVRCERAWLAGEACAHRSVFLVRQRQLDVHMAIGILVARFVAPSARCPIAFGDGLARIRRFWRGVFVASKRAERTEQGKTK